mmetsp:Transcript_60249/g.90818  ORF Transcript_60249/g.90818 Transcript_60249/m.90818 type:complete len:260 (-) Transcript_60249:77-856(-)|eukprot:CAMPEP_0117015312 /NCGR_PEP_ID=MMETSP0472-20121206/12259_1 /TAXON_ID=693140 ORGANISM="Tiarina fusus, Strain LIS" /NCGR_SAMPLE_ID=MMETSP0472 /ASSEMBLY_ACC=CAM_ASM_000603 /LENGTH=259 /DNA_ID=CAMNT_0004719089 /DNA_START=68 /DNA_END=847 /DNA_ORIENTATION=+
MDYRQTILPIVASINEGADLIAGGEFGCALVSLKNALIESRNIHIRFESANVNRNLNHTTTRSISLGHALGTDMVTTDDGDNGDCSLVFRKPVKLTLLTTPPDIDADTAVGPIESNMGVISASIVFNMALSLHLSALTSSTASGQKANSPPRNLRKAVELYERAYQLQAVSENVPPREHFGLLMAILNNLAHAHALLGNHQRSERWSQELLSTLILLVADAQGLNRFSSWDVSSILADCFLQSSCHFIFKSRSRPAAAA